MKAFLIFIALLLLVVALWAGSFFAVGALGLTLEERGQFGDAFGTINSLFTGLAFAALIATIFLQRDELALQRTELKLQREQMILSRGELANQSKVQHAQYIAAVGQIRVAAYQARIEAVKMNSLQLVPSARSSFADQIVQLADGITKIAEDVDRIAKEDNLKTEG